jgi:hypothetical protein
MPLLHHMAYSRHLVVQPVRTYTAHNPRVYHEEVGGSRVASWITSIPRRAADQYGSIDQYHPYLYERVYYTVVSTTGPKVSRFVQAA